jgi:hypothetical protein
MAQGTPSRTTIAAATERDKSDAVCDLDVALGGYRPASNNSNPVNHGHAAAPAVVDSAT